MERKTIGGFIAILRKANGMTQKDLAEKLNVSDKTVSRWERDEGAPDLSLIPVIAEIFSITADELIRGERKCSENSQTQDKEQQAQKTEKQRKRILLSMRSNYRTRSFIAVGLAGLGLIAAMIANLGFNRAYIGFLLGAAFFLIAAVCQAVFINKAFLAVSDDDVQGAEVEDYKKTVVTVGMKAITAIVTLFAACLPLIILPNDAYAGVTGAAWLANGAAYGATGFVLCIIFCYFFTSHLLKRRVFTLPEKQAAVYRHNYKLKRVCVLALATAFLVTFAGHTALTGGWDALSVMEGTSFDDWDSFKAYMEQDVPADHNFAPDPAEEVAPDDGVYYDANGNEITKAESMRRTLEDADGNVVCEYIERNKSVSSVRYSYTDGKLAAVTVYTMRDLYDGSHRIEMINSILAAVYLAEVAGALLVYIKKRAK